MCNALVRRATAVRHACRCGRLPPRPFPFLFPIHFPYLHFRYLHKHTLPWPPFRAVLVGAWALPLGASTRWLRAVLLCRALASALCLRCSRRLTMCRVSEFAKR